MTPHAASVCSGSVVHRRLEPTEHSFRAPLAMVWIDPDRPEELTDHHPLWSSRRAAPARFHRCDYGVRPGVTLAGEVRDDLAAVLGSAPTGEVRLLTQIRRWGWLFNPISVFLAWDDDLERPAGAVLEVTNTPWKERHRYPVALAAGSDDWLTASTDKVLHVSPFLDEDFRYDLRMRSIGDRFELELDVVPVGPDSDGAATPTLRTAMIVTRRRADRRALGRALREQLIPTLRVSAGIHHQALRLWLQRVPFVPHPAKRTKPDTAGAGRPETQDVLR